MTQERPARRGRLTIFLGAAPGVGKTYAMLEAARAEIDRAKRDVVVGFVETHGRYDTAALLLGMEVLPRRRVELGARTLEELDLDRALARRPEVLLVDDLAHTNAEGSRHAKRWQDVEEALASGIDVTTTLDVHHLESLRDVVLELTGAVVEDTLPDSVVERADDVRLVDLPPDRLLERLREGKVAVPAGLGRAAPDYFRKGNLLALRELALRHTAERVDADMQAWKATEGIASPWAASDRLLACVSPSPASARLLRAARRMATSLHGSFLAAYVETPASMRMSARDRAQLTANLRLAQQLGAETVTLTGESAAEETIDYARRRNVTRIIVGKPTHPRWKDLLKPSFLEEIVRRSGGTDVYAISGEETKGPAAEERAKLRPPYRHYAASALVIGGATAVSGLLFGRSQLADVAMVLLLGIVVVAVRFGHGPSIAAAVLSVLFFDFFFIPPYFTFAVTDVHHLLTFAVMFVVATVISNLAQRIRGHADASRERENRTASLYAMSRELAASAKADGIVAVAVRHLTDVFQSDVAILVARENELEARSVGEHTFVPAEDDREAARWALQHGRFAGKTTDTLPRARAIYTPLRVGSATVGVLGLLPLDPSRFGAPDQRELLLTFAGQIASALERATLADVAQRARVQVETEQLRNALLSSVSHDLRTPLAVITGSATTLSETGIDATTRAELLETIVEEGTRLNRLVSNLLDMTRLEAGALRPKKEWQALEEALGSALNRLEDRLRGRVVEARLPPDLPMAPFDPVLIEQVLFNLLDNALRYTPPGSPIEIRASAREGALEVDVLDRGPGVPPSEEERIFDKFHRHGQGRDGVGLGLTICRGIVTAHGGELGVSPRDGGGACFRFTLPLAGEAPRAPVEEREIRETAS